MDSYPPTGGCPQPEIPVMHQPQSGAGYPTPGSMQLDSELLPMPTTVPIYPRGLEYLAAADNLFAYQIVEFIEDCFSCEDKNKYTIKNSKGVKYFTAKEDTDCCTRNCCRSCRPFDMKLKDNFDREVIHLARGLRCSACCFPCCLQRLEVFAPPGHLIGMVVQEWSIGKPQFRIENERGEAVFRIEGPCCTCLICGDVDFKVLSTSGVEVGKISRKWSDLLNEALSNNDTFGITFPIDQDVKIKATLLGALFLIDFMFFDKALKKECDRGTCCALGQFLSTDS